MSLLLRAGLRHSLRHPWQVGLSLLGVALGVAAVVAVDLSNASAQRAFALSTETVFGRATHQVLGGPSGLDERLYVRLVREGAAGEAAPVVSEPVALPAAPGRSFTLLGLDPLAEAAFRPWLDDLRGRGGGLGVLLTEPATVLLSAPTARRLGLAAGERLALRAGGREREVRVAGIIHPRDALTRSGLDDVLVADIATAQELLGMQGRLTRIDLIVPRGGAGARALEALRVRLPAGASLVRSGARTRTAARMTHAFELNLRMLSLLALVVGMFLVYNTVTFSVIQRRTLIGTLRALGVTRAGILRGVLTEAGLLGLAGTALGVALGVALAHALLDLVARTINDLYFSVSVREVAVAPLSLAKGVALGVGAALLAAAVPAREATRVPPRAALLRSLAEAGMRRAAPRAALAGVLLLLAAAGLLMLPGGRLGAGFAALFAVVAGCTLLTPAAVRALVRGLQGPARRLGGALGAMSVRGVDAGLSRTAVAIAALMVALATTVGVGVMVDSFRQSVAQWLHTTLRADLYVSTPGTHVRGPLPPDLVRRLAAVEGVRHASAGRTVTVQGPDGPVEVIAIRMAPESYAGFRILEGDARRAWQRFDEAGAVLVSEPFAWRHGLGPGAGLTLHTDRGPRRFAVAAVFRDYGSERGVVLMSRDTYERWWDDRRYNSVGIYAAAGVDPGALAGRLARAAGHGRELEIRSNRAIREASLEVFDRTFTITVVLRLLATAVAFVGVLSALMALQLERSREIAVLRAQGLTRGQVWGVVGAQTGVMGLISGLLAIPLGLLLALLLILVINRRSFGWTLEVHVEPAILLQAVALALAAALLAGLYPAARMANTPPALALREE